MPGLATSPCSAGSYSLAFFSLRKTGVCLQSMSKHTVPWVSPLNCWGWQSHEKCKLTKEQQQNRMFMLFTVVLCCWKADKQVCLLNRKVNPFGMPQMHTITSEKKTDPLSIWTSHYLFKKYRTWASIVSCWFLEMTDLYHSGCVRMHGGFYLCSICSKLFFRISSCCLHQWTRQ